MTIERQSYILVLRYMVYFLIIKLKVEIGRFSERIVLVELGPEQQCDPSPVMALAVGARFKLVQLRFTAFVD